MIVHQMEIGKVKSV